MRNHIALCLLLSSIGTILLSGCTPQMNIEQCQNTDWYQLGVSDGTSGKPKRNLEQESTNCAALGLKTVESSYTQGWKNGIQAFCQPKHALRLGQTGQDVGSTCSSFRGTAFETAYSRGLRQFCISTKGYQVGRQGLNYPTACSPTQFPRFANAYNEGKSRYNQIENLKSQLSSVQTQISNQQMQISKIDNQIEIQRKRLNTINVNKSGPNLARNYQQSIEELQNQNKSLQNQLESTKEAKSSLEQQIEVMQSDKKQA